MHALQAGQTIHINNVINSYYTFLYNRKVKKYSSLFTYCLHCACYVLTTSDDRRYARKCAVKPSFTVSIIAINAAITALIIQ